MKNKLTYFDFLVYFIPGAAIIWICTVLAKYLGILSALKTGNILTESLAFIVLAFVVGNFIQYRSQRGTEIRIKKKHWSGAFVSERFLLKASKLCPEFKRQRYINLLQKYFVLDEKNAKILEDSESKEAREISHSMYRECFTFITDKGIGAKAIKANEYYNFFRGLSTTCAYLSIIFATGSTYLLVRFFANRTATNLAHAMIMLLFTVLFGYAVHAFRISAKQRGELHVTEVFDSMTGYFTEKSS